jgi:hypothetical protein
VSLTRYQSHKGHQPQLMAMYGDLALLKPLGSDINRDVNLSVESAE